MTIRATRASAAGANAASAHPTARTSVAARGGTADASAHRSAEELRGELVQVLLPVDPGVAAGRLLVLRFEGQLLEQVDCALRAVQDEVVLAGGEPEHLHVPGRGGRQRLGVLLRPRLLRLLVA